MNLPYRRRSEPPLPPVMPVSGGHAGHTRLRRAPRAEVAICYHCASTDTMEPFARPARVFLLSRIIPALRWRYCRTCTRHFLTLHGDVA